MSSTGEQLLHPGEAVDLSNCDREPIHIPGAIQPHGLLLTLSEPELRIAQASANVGEVVARPLDEILGAPLQTLLSADSVRAVQRMLAEPDAELDCQVDVLAAHGPVTYQLRAHRSEGLLVSELEPDAASGAVSSAAFVREVSEAMVGMQGASGVNQVSQRAAEQVRRLTGYDRVMVYRFDADDHGEVIAEAREASLQSFLGHHYPATDIPKQARLLYLRQTIRMIVDVDYEPSPIVPADNPLTGRPLDLGLATLRSVSPIHLQYLRNMGVTGTMTISLKREGELWGMIACHHNSPHYIDSSIRAACEFIGEMLSFQFAREEEADLARERAALGATRVELLGMVRNGQTLSAGLRAGADLLMDLCSADGVSVVLDSERITAGALLDETIEQTLVDRIPGDGSALVLDRLPGELAGLAERTDLCGALALTLPRGVGRHVIWYRHEWRHHVTWGGDPSESLAPDLSSRDAKDLSPRRSFEAWSQAVIGRSRPWRVAQVEAATDLVRALAEHMVAAMRDQLAHVALHDPLTGLPNRALLMESLQRVLRARPTGELDLVGLLFLDIDNFKLINESFGHRGGDLLLQQVAVRLSEALREGDIVGRLGGDEFIVVMQNVSDLAAVAGAAARIQRCFERPFDLDGSETAVSVSVGIAGAALSDARSPSDLLRDADTAMYEAKRRGRGRSVQFHAALDESRRRRVELERHLPGAVERGEMLLEYQPLYTGDGRVAGLEALVRWDGPALGRVAPGEFIPLAEEIGLIEDIGQWVLKTAFARLAELRAAGATELAMAVNLSARQLGDIGLPVRLEALLAEHEIPRHLATMEITEGLLVASGGPGVETLNRIRALGVQVAIDDFGTGFSSLAYLRRLPADVLKIDRAFVAELGKEPADADIVGAVIDLARRLSIRTVAEGVETEEQLGMLRELCCDLMQGFLLARPMPSDRLPALLAP